MLLNLGNELKALIKLLSLYIKWHKLLVQEFQTLTRVLTKEKVQCQTLTDTADKKEIYLSLCALSSKLLVSASTKEKLIKS